ncbi:MAG: GNAT family N-acetyltransferase, partial [Bacilli bacterium]|nr:GNAT family N-acetyltransferase [Bacilli bacterium]
MEIIEYEDKYLEDVKDLLVELEEYVIHIDQDHLDQMHPEYRDKIAIINLEKIKNNNGKCFLTIKNNTVIGLIMGIIRKYDELDYIDYKCPKQGEITEFIVSKKIRSNGVGQL